MMGHMTHVCVCFVVASSVGLVVNVTVTSAPVADRACRVRAVWAGLVVVTLAFRVTVPFMFRFIFWSWFDI